MTARSELIATMQGYAKRHPVTASTPQNETHSGMWDKDTRLTLVLAKDPAMFDGQPCWVGSLERLNSRRHHSSVEFWIGSVRQAATQTVLRLLEGLGNPHWEKHFHNNAAFSVARAITGAEWETLSVDFHDADPIKLHAGPVQVSKDTRPSRPAAYPCQRPIWEPLAGEPGNLLLKVPRDCKNCDPCVDRMYLESERQRVRRELEEKRLGQAAYEEWLASDAGKEYIKAYSEAERAAGNF